MYAIAYHGTCRKFKEFSTELCNEHSFFGSGVYLTDSLDDVKGNYYHKGPDRFCQVETYMELHGTTKIVAQSKFGLSQKKFRILRCALSIPNVFDLYNPGVYVSFSRKEMRKWAESFNNIIYHEDEFCMDDFNNLIDYVSEGITTFNLHKEICRLYSPFEYPTNIFNHFLRYMGFDGVIQHAMNFFPVMLKRVGACWETKHFFVLNPKKVKILEVC